MLPVVVLRMERTSCALQDDDGTPWVFVPILRAIAHIRPQTQIQNSIRSRARMGTDSDMSKARKPHVVGRRLSLNAKLFFAAQEKSQSLEMRRKMLVVSWKYTLRVDIHA